MRNIFLFLSFAALGLAGQLQLRVQDAVTGEPLSSARAELPKLGLVGNSDAAGILNWNQVPDGTYALRVSLANYALLRREITVAGDLTTVEVLLLQDASSRVRSAVTVSASPFVGVEPATAFEKTFSKIEIQALGTNIFADPLRAAQGLPGITVSDDKRGEISIRGSAFDQVGIQMDGVLLEGFLHQLGGGDLSNGRDRATVSVLSTDRVADISVLTGAMPASQGFATAGMLSLFTRDGNRDRTHFRLSTGVQLGTSAVVDGPITQRASYLLSVRGSLPEYIARSGNSEANDKGGVLFNDGQAKFIFDLTSRHRSVASVVGGSFRVDDPKRELLFGRNTVTKGDSFNGAAILSWDWTPASSVSVRTRLFHLQTNLRARNFDSVLLARLPASQYGGRQDVSVSRGRHQLQAGLYVRSMHGEQSINGFLSPLTPNPSAVDFFRGDTRQESYYVQDTVSLVESLQVTLGGRVERNQITKENRVQPRGGLSWQLGSAGTLRLGFGRHNQFAPLSALLGNFGNPRLRAASSTHFNIGFERPLGERARITAEVFRRQDRDQIFTLDEARLLAGRVVEQEAKPQNSLSGTADGFELTLQRRSGNRFSGWASYSYLRTRYREAVSSLRFPTDLDQRHTGSLFGVYRLTPTWSLNAVWRYSSGQPYAGFFRRQGTDFYLAADRNQLRLRPYSRVDLRLSKNFRWRRSLSTISIEGINLLNRSNLDFSGIERYDRTTGRILNEPAVTGISRFAGFTYVLQF